MSTRSIDVIFHTLIKALALPVARVSLGSCDSWWKRHLEGREGELKESLIGVDVYGRRPDYDPKLDSTVRSEMTRFRARLSKYYSTEGSPDLLVLDLPRGSSVPSFFRALGNYSAHKVHYTCRREYIAEKIDRDRAMIDELLHKAGLRT